MENNNSLNKIDVSLEYKKKLIRKYDVLGRFNRELLLGAIDIAKDVHQDEFTRNPNDKQPFIVHPLRSAIRLADMGASTIVIISTVLHDVLESREGRRTLKEKELKEKLKKLPFYGRANERLEDSAKEELIGIITENIKRVSDKDSSTEAINNDDTLSIRLATRIDNLRHLTPKKENTTIENKIDDTENNLLKNNRIRTEANTLYKELYDSLLRSKLKCQNNQLDDGLNDFREICSKLEKAALQHKSSLEDLKNTLQEIKIRKTSFKKHPQLEWDFYKIQPSLAFENMQYKEENGSSDLHLLTVTMVFKTLEVNENRENNESKKNNRVEPEIFNVFMELFKRDLLPNGYWINNISLLESDAGSISLLIGDSNNVLFKFILHSKVSFDKKERGFISNRNAPHSQITTSRDFDRKNNHNLLTVKTSSSEKINVPDYASIIDIAYLTDPDRFYKTKKVKLNDTTYDVNDLDFIHNGRYIEKNIQTQSDEHNNTHIQIDIEYSKEDTVDFSWIIHASMPATRAALAEYFKQTKPISVIKTALQDPKLEQTILEICYSHIYRKTKF